MVAVQPSWLPSNPGTSIRFGMLVNGVWQATSASGSEDPLSPTYESWLTQNPKTRQRIN
jgi:hypothetical protein